MSDNPFSAGEIITFYSYKGGAGRSMALANIACLLAKKMSGDEKTLMIDWDLEAPGLHQFFHGQFELPSGRLGLIDLFYEIRTRLQNNNLQEEIPTEFFDDLNLEKYVVNTNTPNTPSLFILPAGRFDDEYPFRVNEFDWAEFFNNSPSVITQFAHYLRRKYKYTLIDSRTGYTDISGICTSLMPEKLVVVFTPNRQNLKGVVELIRNATNYRKQSDDLRPLIVFPLASRIENAEEDLQEEWRFGYSDHGVDGYQKQFESLLKETYHLKNCDLTNYFDEIQIQYVPKYAYGEEISVLSQRAEERLSLARSFENFAEKLIISKNPWEVTSKTYTFALEKLPKSKTGLPLRILLVIILILLGFVGILLLASVYNYTSLPTLLLLLWLFCGILLDILKPTLATLGNSTTQATESLKKRSRRGREEILKVDPSKIEFRVMKDIAKVFGQMKCSLLSWATNFLRQVVELEGRTEITEIADDSATQPSNQNRNDTSYLVPCENNIKAIFNNRPENKYAGEQIIGASLGFLALLAFLYADAAQGAQTITLLFKETIPPFLNSIIIPLVMASAGSTLILGLLIGDSLGLTHLGLFPKTSSKSPLVIIIANLILSLSLSTIIALTRMELLGTDSQSVKTIVNIAQSIVILPMLVTTFLLFRGLFGIYVALSAILALLSVPLVILELFIRILSDLLRSGLLGGSFIITRIIWLTLGALELVFFLLEVALKGSFAVLIYIVVGIFFIPSLIFNIILRVTKQEQSYKAFLENVLKSSLQTGLDDDISQRQETQAIAKGKTN